MKPVDRSAVLDVIRRALDAAGLKATSPLVKGITGTVERALGVKPSVGPAPAGAADHSSGSDQAALRSASEVRPPTAPPSIETSPDASSSSFTLHAVTRGAAARRYKLYRPAVVAATPALVVMLHGCKQDPDDFAAGTRMNLLAERHGFLVAYPEQSGATNAMRCWNWFEPADQRRDSGEPALIAAITQEVMQRHGVDPARIYLAGLSAGAAMAVVLGHAYPELYAAIGAHSGLPYASAHGVATALAAMQGMGTQRRSGTARAAQEPLARPIRTIVLHGDADTTVRSGNGEAVVNDALAAFELTEALNKRIETLDVNGRRCAVTTWSTLAGRRQVEYWRVADAGHAWFGGSSQGSYTDARGPDASERMWAFFNA